MSVFDLTGETAVVTGADGARWGYESARKCGCHWCAQPGGARNQTVRMKSTLEVAIACATDVTDVAAVERLADAALSEYGSLNMWVNNAGGSPTQAPLVDIEPQVGANPTA